MKVPFTEDAIRTYIDTAITAWRINREHATTLKERTMAEHYVDAYQSVRISLFGELLPEEKGDLS